MRHRPLGWMFFSFTLTLVFFPISDLQSQENEQTESTEHQDNTSSSTDNEEDESLSSISWGDRIPEQEDAKEEESENGDSNATISWSTTTATGQEKQSDWRDAFSRSERDEDVPTQSTDITNPYFQTETWYWNLGIGGGSVASIGVSYFLIPGVIGFTFDNQVSIAPWVDTDAETAEDWEEDVSAAYTMQFGADYYFLGKQAFTPYAGLSSSITFVDGEGFFAIGLITGYDARFGTNNTWFAELGFYVDENGNTAFRPALGYKF